MKWSDILNAEQLAAYHANIAALDASFARRNREFYESRTADQLPGLARGAWNCNEVESYVIANSYAALQAPQTR
jgi:hypothetical protein